MGHGAVGGLFVLQLTGGQAQIAGAVDDGLDAGAGAGAVVVDGDAAVVLHEGLGQDLDHLLHGGGAVGVDHAGQRGGSLGSLLRGAGGDGGGGRGGTAGVAAGAAGKEAQAQGQGANQGKTLFHFVFILQSKYGFSERFTVYRAFVKLSFSSS